MKFLVTMIAVFYGKAAFLLDCVPVNRPFVCIHLDLCDHTILECRALITFSKVNVNASGHFSLKLVEFFSHS